MFKFLKRLFCRHKGSVWKVVDISYDGATIIECIHCGKVKRVPL